MTDKELLELAAKSRRHVTPKLGDEVDVPGELI